MAKRIEIDGKFYRLRRGKLVEIPADWIGKITYPQTIRRRTRDRDLQRKNDGRRTPRRRPAVRPVPVDTSDLT